MLNGTNFLIIFGTHQDGFEMFAAICNMKMKHEKISGHKIRYNPSKHPKQEKIEVSKKQLDQTYSTPLTHVS